MLATAYTKNSTNFEKTYKRILLVISIIVLPIFLSTLMFAFIFFFSGVDFYPIGAKTDYASIQSPDNRSIVNRNFTIKGTLSEPLKKHSYYLVEFRQNLYWPKYDLGNKATVWSKDLIFRGKNTEYVTYRVIMAKPELRSSINSWFSTSQKTGKYPGMSDISDSSVVASIRVKSL